MAKGYWIARVDVADADVYRRYIAANAEALRKYGARFLVRGGNAECAEGTSRQRNVVLEFPTYDAALACWHSPEYQAALKIRQPIATADTVIVEGYDGAQPV